MPVCNAAITTAFDHGRKNSPKAVTDLLAWYQQHARQLPWRTEPESRANPYFVWLSEIMLQQTTVATVENYFSRFITRWPVLEALAAADREEVLAAWAGLGYYSRARNLHRTAQLVVTQHGGHFPDTEAGLRALPGIGRYTAAAIVAIAFGKRAVVVDANIERVMARWGNIRTPLPAARPLVYALMDGLTPEHHSGTIAQALMDIGSSICIPARKTVAGTGGLKKNKGEGRSAVPKCDCCPLAANCLGRHQNPQLLPIKQPKKPRSERHGLVLVVRDPAGRVLLIRRPEKGLLGGMSVFPGSGWEDGSPDRRDYPLHDAEAIAFSDTPATAGGLDKSKEAVAFSDTPAWQLLERIDRQATVKGVRLLLNDQVEHVFTHFRAVLQIMLVEGVVLQTGGDELADSNEAVAFSDTTISKEAVAFSDTPATASGLDKSKEAVAFSDTPATLTNNLVEQGEEKPGSSLYSLRWVSPEEMAKTALPTVMRKIWQKLPAQ